MFTIHVHLGPKLRMSGAIPLLSLYTFYNYYVTKSHVFREQIIENVHVELQFNILRESDCLKSP
jgi:hypothetical protein